MPPRKAPKSRARTRSADTTHLPLFSSARHKLETKRDLERIEGRPDFVSTGLPKVDRALRGGFPVGGTTLVAARSKMGATSMLMGAALHALKHGEQVAYFTERLREEQLRGRFVVLESRVNGYRFRAGFVSAEDRIALAAARERIPWRSLSLVARRQINPDRIDADIFSYRPLLVIADVTPRSNVQTSRNVDRFVEGVERLCSLARKHRVALVVRGLLNRGRHRPDVLELPGVGEVASLFDSVVLLHRDLGDEPDGSHSGEAEASIVRACGRDVEPRLVKLRFDGRFAGLLEP